MACIAQHFSKCPNKLAPSQNLLDFAVRVDGVDTSTVTEVLVGFASSFGAAQKNAVRCFGILQSQLIESNTFATVAGDASAGSGRESQGADLHGRQRSAHPHVVSDSTADDCSFAILAPHVLRETRDRQRRAIRSGHEQTLENHLVLSGVCAAS